MSREKIPSLVKSVSLTLIFIIGLPVLWWFFLDFPMTNISDDTRRKFAQIGLVINLIAGLSMVVRYLWLNNYNERLEQIYQMDKQVVLKYDRMKYDICDEMSREQAVNQCRNEQAPLYKEVGNYLKFDKVESIHMFIGIVGLCVGTFFQLVAAG